MTNKAKQRKQETEIKYVEDYYSKPLFNLFYKWIPLKHQNVDVFSDESNENPSTRYSWVLWKSKTTGRIT